MGGPAEFWDQRYADPRLSFGAEPNAFLVSESGRFARGQRVFVPGDGEGRNGVWLARQGLVVETVDASPKGVEKARALAAERGVGIEASAADLAQWTWPTGHYDGVVSIYLHFPEVLRQNMHHRMLASLKSGGFVLLEAYTPRQLQFRVEGSVGGPSDVGMLMTEAQLRDDFAGAEIVSLIETLVELDEGHRHRGRSAVVRLVARKR